MWLNEGFATYLTGLWNEVRRGPEYAAAGTWGRYRGVTGADDRGPRVLVRRFWGADLGRADPYGKGASVLRMLRVMLGDEVFLAGFASYTREHRGTLVETADLRRVMEDVSGMSLDWFFDQWVYLPGHPKLTVSHEVKDDGARLRVTIKQTQDTSGATPLFTLPIDLEIATSAGSRIERVWMDSAELSATFELDGELRWVAVDPQGGLLAVINHPRGPDERVAQLLGTEHLYAQVGAFRALRHLEGTPTEAERAAIAGFLRDEAGPEMWRLEAARVLGAWRDEVSTELLLEVLAAERTRGAAASTRLTAALCTELGRGLARPGVIAALDRSLTREPVEYVQAEALTSLGKLLEEDARGRAITALRAGPTDQRILERKAAELLGRHGRASDLGALAPYRRMDVHRDLRNAALWASARIAGREPVGLDRDAAREPVARDAERVLYDIDLRGRQTAVSLLAQVGDARSIAELEALRRRENVASLQEAAERAIDSIRTRQDRDPDPVDGELETRLERLEERLDAAEAELKELDERR
jgi:aminopeptidase N